MNDKPKNYYGFAHELPKEDERLTLFEKQREERGFDDSELWSLDCTLFKFLLPRLKALVEIRERIFVDPSFHKEMKELIELIEEDNALPNPRMYELLYKCLPSMWY